MGADIMTERRSKPCHITNFSFEEENRKEPLGKG